MSHGHAKTKPRDVAIFEWVVALMLIGFGVAAYFLARPAPAPRLAGEPDRLRMLGDFRLTDRTGREVQSAELRDMFLIVNFVFTSCTISCAQVNQRMAEVQELTRPRDDVRLVSFTVDPGTDSAPVLAEFGARFGADTNRWLLLTGDKTRLYELIEDSFLKRDPTLMTSTMPGGFVRPERIVLVDRTGRIRRYFDGFNRNTPAAIMNLLNELSAEKLSP